MTPVCRKFVIGRESLLIALLGLFLNEIFGNNETLSTKLHIARIRRVNNFFSYNIDIK